MFNFSKMDLIKLSGNDREDQIEKNKQRSPTKNILNWLVPRQLRIFQPLGTTKMKSRAIIILSLISICTFGQSLNYSDYRTYPNDSILIFPILNKSSEKIVRIGNRFNGLERTYSKINGQFICTYISFSKDSLYQWVLKPNCQGKYHATDCFFHKLDSSDIVIPFENGKPWIVMTIRNGKICGQEIAFYQNQNVRILIDYEKSQDFEYYENGVLKTKMNAKTLTHWRRASGIELEYYDSNGNMIFKIIADYILHEIVRNGIVEYYNNKGELIKKEQFSEINIDEIIKELEL